MEKFIKNFTNQMLNQDYQKISAETIFRDLDDWDSLSAMAVIAMIEDIYFIKISDEEFINLKTIQQLYNFITKHK